MHIPSHNNLQEILAVPEMVRLTIADEGSERKPTFLIRTDVLKSKYLLQLPSYKIVLLPLSNGWLAYGLEIEDDPEHPMLLWSIIEEYAEIEAFKKLATSPVCSLAIFNETGANVAFVTAKCDFGNEPIELLFKHINLHPDKDRLGPKEAVSALNKIRNSQPSKYQAWIHGIVTPDHEWKTIQASYITSQLSVTRLDLIDLDEGGQQEQLVEWLTDGINPSSVHRSPQVSISETKSRELTDVIATSELTYFLFESKSLSILGRSPLPSRKKLSKNLSKHLKKATDQLRGATRHIKSKKEVFNINGEIIDIPSSYGHAIIMVPNIDLISRDDDKSAKILEDFSAETNHLLHILDPAELLRIVQASLKLVEMKRFSKPVDAFDFLLMQRFGNAVDKDVSAIEIIHRFPGHEHKMGTGYLPEI